MPDMKEKLHQATEGLKQAKAKMEPYLRKAKALTLAGIHSIAIKMKQVKNNYLQKKATEKENLAKTSRTVTPASAEAKKDGQQPPRNS
jgi:hypothetical protein